MLDLVVRGRFALPGGHIEDGEIGIAQGRIAALAGPGELDGAERIDVPAGQLVLPGHVDAHVHTGSAPGEGVERATASAAAGGVTTIPHYMLQPVAVGVVLVDECECCMAPP